MKKSNREYVRGHLQIMHIWAEFALEKDLDFYTAGHMKKMAEWTMDALALLEAPTPVGIEIEGGGSTWWYVCGECHGQVDSSDIYCRHCGSMLIDVKKEGRKKARKEGQGDGRKARKTGEEKREQRISGGCEGCAYAGSEDCPKALGVPGDFYCPNGKLGG